MHATNKLHEHRVMHKNLLVVLSVGYRLNTLLLQSAEATTGARTRTTTGARQRKRCSAWMMTLTCTRSPTAATTPASPPQHRCSPFPLPPQLQPATPWQQTPQLARQRCSRRISPWWPQTILHRHCPLPFSSASAGCRQASSELAAVLVLAKEAACR